MSIYVAPSHLCLRRTTERTHCIGENNNYTRYRNHEPEPHDNQ